MNNKGIPDSYFEDDFQTDILDEDKIVGLLGPNPSPEQRFKYGLCSEIAQAIKARALSNAEAGKIVGLDGSDVSRLLNLHIDRFTIDRLLSIFSKLEKSNDVWDKITKLSKSIQNRVAS